MMSRLTPFAIVGFLAIGSDLNFADEPKNLGRPAKDLASWRVEQCEGVKAGIAAAADGVLGATTERSGFRI